MSIKIIAIIGARPQFIKHAPLELASINQFELKTIHTGQHYDEKMSNIFFSEFSMKAPNYQLNCGNGMHGEQTASMLIAIEKILLKEQPDAVIVYGDTNSTLAGALASSKLNIPLIHIEAGLRSFNKEMPEEINRVLTDHISTILIAPTNTAVYNLNKENIVDNVFQTGDIMSDMTRISVEYLKTNKKPRLLKEKYYLATLHRPYNTDLQTRIKLILDAFETLPFNVVFPLHPRTINKLKQFNIYKENYKNIIFIEPQSYFENISLLLNCEALLTDSGGMQKEAYILKKRCITIRSETEWVETLKGDWNQLVFTVEELTNLKQYLNKKLGPHKPNIYGDSYAAKEIVRIITSSIQKTS